MESRSIRGAAIIALLLAAAFVVWFAIKQATSIGAGAGIVPINTDNEVRIPAGVELIYWEYAAGMGWRDSQRLTLWADGRSEILIVKHANGKPKVGWTVQPTLGGFEFRKTSAFPTANVKQMFNSALISGIHELKTINSGASDCGDIIVGVQINGQLTKTTISMCAARDDAAPNYRRYLAVQRIIGTFDRTPDE